jgi:hypothetical protein
MKPRERAEKQLGSDGVAHPSIKAHNEGQYFGPRKCNRPIDEAL